MTITRGHGKEIDAMIEQAYRRGYDQGFYRGSELPKEARAAARIKVYAWRCKRDGFTPPPYSSGGEK